MSLGDEEFWDKGVLRLQGIQFLCALILLIVMDNKIENERARLGLRSLFLLSLQGKNKLKNLKQQEMHKYGWDKKGVIWWEILVYFSNIDYNVRFNFIYGGDHLNQ